MSPQELHPTERRPPNATEDEHNRLTVVPVSLLMASSTGGEAANVAELQPAAAGVASTQARIDQAQAKFSAQVSAELPGSSSACLHFLTAMHDAVPPLAVRQRRVKEQEHAQRIQQLQHTLAPVEQAKGRRGGGAIDNDKHRIKTC